MNRSQRATPISRSVEVRELGQHQLGHVPAVQLPGARRDVGIGLHVRQPVVGEVLERAVRSQVAVPGRYSARSASFSFSARSAAERLATGGLHQPGDAVPVAEPGSRGEGAGAPAIVTVMSPAVPIGMRGLATRGHDHSVPAIERDVGVRVALLLDPGLHVGRRRTSAASRSGRPAGRVACCASRRRSRRARRGRSASVSSVDQLRQADGRSGCVIHTHQVRTPVSGVSGGDRSDRCNPAPRTSPRRGF